MVDDIGLKLRTVAKKRQMSMTDLAKKSGISRSFLYAALKGDNKLSFQNVAALCAALKVDLGTLHKMDQQFLESLPEGALDAELLLLDVEGSRELKQEIANQAERLIKQVWDSAFKRLTPPQDAPTIDEMIRWWEVNNGRMENVDKIAPYIGVYEARTHGSLELHAKSIGFQSLAATRLWTTDPEKLRRYMDSLDPKSRESIVYSYDETQKRQAYSLVRRNMIVDVPELPFQYSITYSTLLLPMSNGYVVNYSQFVGSGPVVNPGQGVLGNGSNTRQAAQTPRGSM